MFADKDTGHPYRPFSTAPIDDAPKALCPRNAALKVNVEVVGHQPTTVTGHCRDGLGGLAAGLPLNAVGGHMSSVGTVGERVEHPPHVAYFLGIEHVVENREDALLFLGYSHGGHPLRLPSSAVSSPWRAPGNGPSVTPGAFLHRHGSWLRVRPQQPRNTTGGEDTHSGNVKQRLSTTHCAPEGAVPG